MLLIGQYDSPYVRRVGIALKLYGIPFQHEAYAVFRDAEKIAAYNPLRKVPTLVLDDGTVLSETFVCLELIDERVAGEHPERHLRSRAPACCAARACASAPCAAASARKYPASSTIARCASSPRRSGRSAVRRRCARRS
jgi:glutathione S-transferase